MSESISTAFATAYHAAIQTRKKETETAQFQFNGSIYFCRLEPLRERGDPVWGTVLVGYVRGRPMGS